MTVPVIDKIDNTITSYVTFSPGEQPTDLKLTGMMTSVYEGVEALEAIFGDIKGDTTLLNVYTNTLASDLGDRSALNPSVVPSFDIPNYVQRLQFGKAEHELDMIPVIGPAGELILSSTDSSIDPAKKKDKEEDLLIVGDWTIRPGINEAGKNKTSRKLIAYAPSNGGSVIFHTVTTGRGTGYSGGTFNTIPEMATVFNSLASPSDFLLITLIGGIYTVTLPNRIKQYDVAGNIVDATVSNTNPAVFTEQGVTQSYELPTFWFNPPPHGLDISTSSVIPDNYIDIYKVVANGKPVRISGINVIRSASSVNNLKKSFTFEIESPTNINLADNHFLVVGGSSLNRIVGSLMDVVFNHNHDGDDMVRAIQHKSLMGLRTNNALTGAELTDRSKYYGPSKINNNDHSMYFHRDGFIDADIGGGANIIRGDAVIGSRQTGLVTDHPNYNNVNDSYSLVFGKHNLGGSLSYKLSVTQNASMTGGRIPMNFTGNVLNIIGAPITLSGLPTKTVYIDDFLRVKSNAVIGTSKADDLIISGDAYIGNSAILLPKLESEITTPEEGQIIYSTSKRNIVVYNGASWVSATAAGYVTSVGNPLGPSYGAFNGSNATVIQDAIEHAVSLGGGTVLIQKGVYTLGGTPINMRSNVYLVGTGPEVVLSQTSSAVAVSFAAGITNSGIRNLKITGAQTGISFGASNSFVREILLENNQTGIIVLPSATNSTIASSNKFSTNTININAQNTAMTVSYEEKGPVRFNSGIPFLSLIDKGIDLYKWVKVSGTATATYNNTADCISGIGRWEFLLGGASARYEVNEFLPISIGRGVGGNIGVIKVAGVAPKLFAGIIGYDSNLTQIAASPVRAFLTTGAGVAVTTAWAEYRNLMFGADAATVTKFPIGTKYIKPYIEIQGASNDKIAIDDFGIYHLNGSWGALYY